MSGGEYSRDLNRLPISCASAFSRIIPTFAGATIVPMQGIDGVKLRQTEKQVWAATGKPSAISRTTNELGKSTQWMYRDFSVLFQTGSGVTSVLTFSCSQRTKSDIGSRVDGGRRRPQAGGRLTTFSTEKEKVKYVDVSVLVVTGARATIPRRVP